MIPVSVGWVVQQQQASVGQLQPDHLHPPAPVLSSAVPVPQDEVPASTEGDRGDRAPWGQFSFIISVLPNVVTAIFIPAVGKQTQHRRNASPSAHQHCRFLIFLQYEPVCQVWPSMPCFCKALRSSQVLQMSPA